MLRRRLRQIEVQLDRLSAQQTKGKTQPKATGGIVRLPAGDVVGQTATCAFDDRRAFVIRRVAPRTGLAAPAGQRIAGKELNEMSRGLQAANRARRVNHPPAQPTD